MRRQDLIGPGRVWAMLSCARVILGTRAVALHRGKARSMSIDARIRFTADTPAELPFREDHPMTHAPAALALSRGPDPLEDLRAKVDRAELLARQAEANLRVAIARAELVASRARAT